MRKRYREREEDLENFGELGELVLADANGHERCRIVGQIGFIPMEKKVTKEENKGGKRKEEGGRKGKRDTY